MRNRAEWLRGGFARFFCVSVWHIGINPYFCIIEIIKELEHEIPESKS